MIKMINLPESVKSHGLANMKIKIKINKVKYNII